MIDMLTSAVDARKTKESQSENFDYFTALCLLGRLHTRGDNSLTEQMHSVMKELEVACPFCPSQEKAHTWIRLLAQATGEYQHEATSSQSWAFNIIRSLES